MLSILIGIILLLVLMTWAKLDAFFGLLITCFVVGVLNGSSLSEVLGSVTKGMGDTLQGILLILVFGAMLGKLVEENGAAKRVTDSLMARFGEKNAQFAILLTALLVGLPMLYNAGFLVLIPLVYVLAASARLPLLYLGLPMCAALSVTHGYLPPHPAPTYVSLVYEASINKVLLVGIIAVVPAVLLGGIWLGRWARRFPASAPAALFDATTPQPTDLPRLSTSLWVMLLPVLLMLMGAVQELLLGKDTDYVQWAKYVFGSGGFATGVANVLGTIHFLADPTIALFLAVALGIFTLGIRRGKSMQDVMKSLTRAVSGVAMIFLIIAAGGAFKQVLVESGVADIIGEMARSWHIHPILLAWTAATLIRVTVGSATVATMTAAGMVLPIIPGSGVSPELLVLATGSGSLMFSHVNDVGFWMFKEYFNLSLKHTFLTWTVMECIVGITGLLVALGLHAVGF